MHASLSKFQHYFALISEMLNITNYRSFPKLEQSDDQKIQLTVLEQMQQVILLWEIDAITQPKVTSLML